jgi:hypothetical protein
MNQNINLTFEVQKTDATTGMVRNYVFTIPYNCPSNEALDSLNEILSVISTRVAELLAAQVVTDVVPEVIDQGVANGN